MMVDEKGIDKIISETMTDGLLELDLHGKILQANPAALAMLGFTLQEITQKTHRDLTPAKWHQQESQAIQETNLAQHKDVSVEQEYLRQNNSTFPVLLKPVLLTGPDQKPAKIIILFQDLTRQKEQEQLQQTHHRQLNSLSLITRKLQENDTIDQTVRFVLEALAAAMKYPEVAVPLIAIEDETFSTNKYSDELEYGLTASIFVNGREAGEVTVYYSENKPFALPDEQHILETVAQSLGLWLAQKSAAQELSDFEEQYRSIFDTMTDGFALYEVKNEGRELIVIDWNRAAEKMYNLLRHDMLGQDIKKFFPAMEKNDIYKAILECSRSGEAKTIPLVHYQDAQRDLYLHTIIYQVGDKVATIFRDVTDEEKVRQELIRSEQKFRSLIEGSADAIYLLSLDPVNPKYVDVNQSACQMLHYTREELLSLGPANLDSPKSAALVPERVAKILHEGKALFELEHLTKEGTSVPVEINASLVDVGGQKYILSFARDITERKKKEEELLIANEMMKNINEGVYLISLKDGIIRYANPKFEKMFGYAPGEMNGNHVSIVNAPTERDPAEIAKEIIRELEKTGTWHGEVKNIRKDGTHFWCYANVSLFDHPEYGRVSVSVHTDITERKETAEALSKALQEWAVTFDTMSDGVSIHSPDFTILNINKVLCQMLGKSKEEIIGRKCYEIFHDQNSPLPGCLLEKSQSSLKDEYAEFFEPTLNRWISAAVSPILDKTDKVVKIVHLIKDITERKQTEELIKSERDRAQKYLDIAEVILLALNKEGRIALVNKKGCEILGAEEAELIGKDWFDNFIPEAIRQEVKQAFDQLMKGDLKEVKNYDNCIITKNGAEKYIAWHNTILINNAGEIQGTLSSGEDITESRKIQDELRKQMNELERFNKVTMGREKRIIELKKKVKELEPGYHGQK